MYDLLLKNGRVIDPSQDINGVMDVALTGNKIAALAPKIEASQAKRIVNVPGKIVAPGLIDDHVHCFHTLLPGKATPDGAGVHRGATTVVDAGTVGPITLYVFRKTVVETARSNTYCLLNVALTGLAYPVMAPYGRHVSDFGQFPGIIFGRADAKTNRFEISNWNDIDVDFTRRQAEENRDIVLGIKIRAFGPLLESDGIKPVEVAKKIATDVKLPLVVHVGAMWGDVSDKIAPQILNLLEKGDTLTHIYTGQPGRVIEPGKPISKELKAARDRGVFFDISHGMFNVHFETARHGISEGFIPDIISSDFSGQHAYGPVFGICETMSKLMALGLTVEQVVKMTTLNPALALNIADRHGSLKVGRQADITVLDLVEAKHVFGDSHGGTLEGNSRLIPVFVIKSGTVVT
ncbi:MAG: amidohydrolase/deacetylase family metallohydrolase [Chloroflexi bacterium]|nr:amidohydrolase/deacetylase family metallohydrolase [Chloroflexota bacterium]